MLPGAPLVGFIIVPLLLLAGLYFLESRAWRNFCVAGLVLWLALAIAWPVLYRDWAALFFPTLVVLFWILLAEAKRMFGE